MSIRPVKRLVKAKPTLEGAGVHLRRAFGFGNTSDFDPFLLLDDFRNDVPETDLEPIEPGSHLPGGIIASYDGRGNNETPLWLPEQRALVFADGMTAPGGELRVWGTPWHEKRVLPALRELLELPFEHVIVSHGDRCILAPLLSMLSS